MTYSHPALVGLILGLFVVFAAIVIRLRRVVPTNEVHIIQSRKNTHSYGKDTQKGNIYYEWPIWLPIFGIAKTVLPVSVFDLSLKGYEAYDQGRLPFVVDVVAFFRVEDSNVAAQRVASFAELKSQLIVIVQGAIRTILAQHDIDSIMTERAKFGNDFTSEIQEQLKNWGVVPVKNLELMDIRDANGEQVIHNIMQKKKSLIEMLSRSEVAQNRKKASIAEINAEQESLICKQEAEKAVGVRTAERNKEIGIANQVAEQEIKEAERLTKEKEMQVLKVSQEVQADIDRNVSVIKAEQKKSVSIVEAEGEKQSNILRAEGALEAKKRESEGIAIQGKAKADAETAMQLAPVTAQVTLAKEIGSNEGYQKYLVTIRGIESVQTVGVEQAKALEKAQVKIIANTGNPVNGAKNVMELFTPVGGTNLGGMLEALKNTEEGEKILNFFSPKKEA